ncbi:sensor histidine kinase [Nonomuraea gerenzanensis]|uniref:histidine kinase n=1 Tax=Nonomuraea gerenzanensis TaxID=93944 RepID=A0A1M4EG80_9ACTN|nr:sensor histidine kinase [Nonomuraea gerenzanensis]UBU09483.1 sensor domain-containing protein [Nonomuraea gerenzanensis]SBO97899.1 putative two-component system sensor kinase [Nonomuraea gerenzanensis]
MRIWRELGYTLTVPLMAALGLVHLLIVLAGVVTSTYLVGLPLLAGSVVAARRLGAANRGLVRTLAGTPVPAPAPYRRATGLLNRLGTALGDVTGWRAIIHAVVRLPAAALAFASAAGTWGLGLALLTCPLWWQVPGLPAPGGWAGALLLSVLGLGLLLLAPMVVHLALGLERLLAVRLLGPPPAQARIRTLEETRTQAVEDAAAALRRVERDLHDGPAARLTALALGLSMAREELAEAGDPERPEDQERLERVRALIDGAHRGAKETLSELTDLIRGIHPPALDKGLEVALATLAARSPLPVDLDAELAERPSPAVETIAFFCTAELLANVAKHSGARQAAIRLRAADGRLRLRVWDDGEGGAAVAGGQPAAGSGLRGLTDRVRVVDGELVIHSPAGGPTVVIVDLPLRA